MPATCTVDERGPATLVSFDNSRLRNAFDDALLSELVAALSGAAGRPDCSVIELKMAGPHFCGGWNTGNFNALVASDVEALSAKLSESHALLSRIRALPVPVVAGVRGRIIGFGVGLLAALHLPVVAAQAQAHLPETRFGFTPAGVGFTLATTLARPQAYALLSGARAADGAELVSLGLAATSVPQDRVDATVQALVEHLGGLPAGVSRALVEMVETSRRTGTAEQAIRISAETIATATENLGRTS